MTVWVRLSGAFAGASLAASLALPVVLASTPQTDDIPDAALLVKPRGTMPA
jgi:hypothetical protein